MRGWFASVAGILTAFAALLTAIAGLYAVGIFTGPTPAPTVVPFDSTAPQNDTPAGFRIVELMLGADPAVSSGSCPVTITFYGRISVAGGGGIVSYRFLRSDGASAPVQSLTFDGPGSQDVKDTWSLWASYSGWEAIEILDPESRQSDRATFDLTCS